jgi:hypothetical protein
MIKLSPTNLILIQPDLGHRYPRNLPRCLLLKVRHHLRLRPRRPHQDWNLLPLQSVMDLVLLDDRHRFRSG